MTPPRNPKDSPEFFLGEIYANTNHIKEAIDDIKKSVATNDKRITRLEHDRTKRVAVLGTIVFFVSTFGVFVAESIKDLLHGKH